MSRAADANRSAITRFHEHLQCALDQDGAADRALRRFAEHIREHILIPSARYPVHGELYAKSGRVGCFTYECPGGISWAH